MNNHKLGIIVPYRNRFDQLLSFKSSIKKYLSKSGIDYELIIVEQDDAKNFNRGKLLNVGFIYAKKLKCDYVVLHDVDMLPIDVDYSYCEYPVHLASNLFDEKERQKEIFDEYFGGVTMFTTSDFEKINGYSNDYWGWGYEDTDLLYRCKLKELNLDIKQIKTRGGNAAGLKFNGRDAYVKFKNTIDTDNDFTIFVSFKPDEIFCDHEKYDDTYCIFSIPGMDLNINYNSYSRYNFEVYDENDEIIYINSEIKPAYQTNICVTYSCIRKELKMYQDGELILEKVITTKIRNYGEEKYFYLGAGDPNRSENKKYFAGTINNFTVFDKVLRDSEIKEISNNTFFGLTQNFGDYQSAFYVKSSYDAKFIREYKLIDLSGGRNNGEIVNCEIVGIQTEEYKPVQIPHRRNCKFRLLPHDENGYVNGAWKDITTRYNQLKFYNEVVRGYRNTNEDGLNSCKFKELGNASINNETHITVSI